MEDEETHQINTYTVGSYVLSELQNDGLTSVNPKVTAILSALEENLDNSDFDPIRYFTQHPDNEISQFASNILADKHFQSKLWSKGGSHVESEIDILDQIVPILIKEYKIRNVTKKQDELLQQINEAYKNKDDEKYRELQDQYSKLNEVIKALSRVHGFRAIT